MASLFNLQARGAESNIASELSAMLATNLDKALTCVANRTAHDIFSHICNI